MIIKQNKEESTSEFVKRKSYVHKYVETRLDDNNLLLEEKAANRKPITAEKRNEILTYWKDLIHRGAKYVNLDYYDVYNKVCRPNENLARYMPDSFFYAFVDEWLTDPMHSGPIDDKNLYDYMFHDVLRPETICRKVEDMFFDKDFKRIDADQFFSRCNSYDEVFVKASIGSFGGHGVMVWRGKDVDSINKLYDFVYRFNGGAIVNNTRVIKQYIVQAPLKQHEVLAAVNPSSINTIRIMSLVWNEEVKMLSSVLRMGINGSRVDNCSSGGIVCGIDEKGICKPIAYDNKANVYYHHPNGTQFGGVEVPGYAECVELVKKLAYRFAGCSRLISWDLAINEKGEPVLIEMNISYGELDFHQLCNGPIFGDMTEEILKKMYEDSWTLNKLIRN